MSANPKLTESSDSVATAPANDAASTHLIVADGHAKMRTYLARSLQPLGTVEAVADGYQALASVYRRIPDLVLSDEKTPKLDGFALLRNLREDDRTKALPIVLLSARAGERARLKAAIAGANDYIVKPFSSRELVARIDAQLQIARQRRAYAEAVRSSQEWQKRLEQLRQGQKELEKSLNAMRRMQTLGSLFLREGNLQSILVETVEVAIAISGADFGNLQVLDPQSSKLTIAAQHGFPDWWLDFWSNVGNGEGACGIALEFGKRVIVEDVARSPIFDGRSLEIQLKAGVRAVQSTPLVSRSGKLLGIFSTHYRNPGRPDERSLARLDMLAMQAADIIERARAEEALKLANAQLIEADRHKNQFLAVLSHELRNPLAPIKNSLLVLDQAVFVSDEAQRARSVIVRQTEQLSRLVDDLLDVTRITRNKVRLQRERLDLNELVRRTTDDHRSLFENNGIRIEFSATDKPADVSADSNRLAQVLGNLLQNAAKFTHRGGKVSVSLEIEPAGDWASIRVADSGVGIAPQALAKLFHPFVQAHTTVDHTKGGLGLGLALVKGIVELHGGEVTARSDGLGKGAEFLVRLPLAPERVSHEPTAAPTSVATRVRRVLIIDDNIDAAETLRSLLELWEHEVSVAYSGPEGMAKAREFRPDAVVCDIGLPGMDGFEVARAFRADKAFATTTLIALSGYSQPEDVERAQAAGFDAHLAKPPEIETLAALLQ